MAKKTTPRKTKKKAATGTATAEGTAGTRGRKKNEWMDGFAAQQLVDYRQKHSLSEAKLSKYLGTTLTSLRNWIAGKNTPGEAKQKEMQELISKDYVAPPEGEKKPRGRPKKEAAGSPEMTRSVAVARDTVAANGDGHPISSSALGDVVAAYVRRLPSDRSLSMDDLEAITARIKKMLLS